MVACQSYIYLTQNFTHIMNLVEWTINAYVSQSYYENRIISKVCFYVATQWRIIGKTGEHYTRYPRVALILVRVGDPRTGVGALEFHPKPR